MDANSLLQTMFCWIDGTIHAELQSEEIVIVGNMEDFLAPPAAESFCSKDIHFIVRKFPLKKNSLKSPTRPLTGNLVLGSNHTCIHG